MFTRKRKIACILLVLVCIATLFLVSCKKDPANPDNPNNGTPTTDYGIDSVYFTVDGENEYLFTISGSTFMISGINGDQAGTFTYENGALTLTFKEGDSTNASAVIENGVLKLTYNGSTYRMLPRNRYNVTFDVDGGSEVAAQKVLNGRYAAKPDDPVKAGYAFIGWYADKAYTTVFAFDTTAISADTTVYARFEAQPTGQVEYTVGFVCEGESFGALKTINGVLHTLPTPAAKDGMEFVGWWISDYQSGEKLTCQYTGQKLTQDSLLYAVYKSADTPLVSVNASGANWNALGANITYRVVVKRGNTTLADTNTGNTSFGFDFANEEAGDYTVTVTVNGKSATAYYRNKALDRASGIRIVSSNVLVFNPVANAQNYTITVVCGTAGHEHELLNNGKSTNFVFANCDMPKDGIRFVITASAEGYLSSTVTYTLFRGLDAVEGLAVSNEKITWYPAENATGYLVGISADGVNYKSYYVSGDTSYDISGLNKGQIYVTVTPVSAGYYSAPATPVQFNKTVLAKPSGITVSGTLLKWNAVEGATGYNVTINGVSYQVTEASMKLTDEIVSVAVSAYDVTVQAVAENAAENSPYSDTVRVNYSRMGAVSYRNGKVYWEPVYGAARYIVRVGDVLYTVNGDQSSAEISFVASGLTEIAVRFVNEAGNESGEASTQVEVYKIELDTCGGSAVATTLYKAFGDDIVLPATTRDGYNFAGWYLTPDSIANGKPYSATVFEERQNILLFATWSVRHFNIKLNPGTNGTVDKDEIEVIYGKYNKAPVASTNDESRYFYGWFSEPNGGGIRYFNETGEATERWNTMEDIELYAFFPTFLKFELLGDEKSYSVSQGDFGIGSLTVLKIPATYNGLPVTTIEAMGFDSCRTLIKVQIPNTILNVEIGTSGINYGDGSAFHYCSNLAEFEVYDAGAKDPLYFTDDEGVLYHKNEKTGDIELAAFPNAKSGIYTIWEGTTVIPGGAFASTYANEINIPYTVTSIEYRAFTGLRIQKITFLATPEGKTAAGLVMDEGAINDCSNLTTLTLPGRISEFSPLAISGCNNLVSIELSGESEDYVTVGEAGRKVLASKDGTTLIYCPKGMSGNYTIPSGITTIGESAFSNCSKLTGVTIPGFVKEIGVNAFYYCTGLNSLELTEEGQPLSIGASAFYNCSGLGTLTLPKRLVKIDKNAFGAIAALTKVTVNSAGDASGKVTFANAAFASTSNKYYITDLEIGSDVPAFSVTGVFGQELARITVNEGNKNYKSIDNVLYNSGVTEIIFYPSARKGEFTLPDTITTVGAGVFQNKSQLTGITIGNKVKSIASNAFSGCKGLKYVIFNDTAAGTTPVALTIGSNAFQNCSALTSISLPSRLTSIAASAFQSCSGLTEITIPEGVTSIGDKAFYGCSKLVSVSLPSTLKTLSLSTASTTKNALLVFDSCSSLATITIAAGNTNYAAEDNIIYALTATKNADGTTVYEKTTLLYCPWQKAGATDITLPDTLTEIAPNAFDRNKNVTSIVIADAEKFTIGTKAFYACNVLRSVTLPAGLTSIAKELFSSCYELESVTIPYTVSTIENKVFYMCKKLSTLNFAETPAGKTPVNLAIADASSSLNSPFSYCPALKTIVFPERLSAIGNYAFGYSSAYFGLESIVLPTTLTRIGNYAFFYEAALKSVSFAGTTKLTEIGNYAFQGCYALKDFDLPLSTASYTIGSSAFMYSGLTEVVIPGCVKELKGNVFDNCYSLTSVSFADDVDGAKLTFGSSVFARTGISSITLPEGITAISDYMFQNSVALTSIHIPSSVTKIGMYAFSGCVSMTSIDFGTYVSEADGKAYSKVSNIGNNAFEKTHLSSFAFPTLEGNTSITLGNELFKYCGLLTSVTISKSVGSIGKAFDNNVSIKAFTVASDSQNFSAEGQVLYNKDKTAIRLIIGLLEGKYEIPGTIKEISASTFRSQIGLTEIVIPASVTKIEANAFENCFSLTSVTFKHGTENTAPTLGATLFKNCYSLAAVELPAKLASIPDEMFYNCYKLESITIPAGVTSIGKSAFMNAGLTSVSIPASVKTIGQTAFATSSSSTPGKIESLTFVKNDNGVCALESIGAQAFKYQIISSVVLPKSVNSIGANAFSYNTNLTSFAIEEGTRLTTLPNSLVANCTALTSFEIPKEITKIDNSAFEGCTALTNVAIPADSALATIGSKAFAGSGLTSFAVPAGVTTIFASAFSKCASLTTVTFAADADLVGIGANCFEYTALETIVLPEKVTMLGSVATTGKVTAAVGTNSQQFYNCEKLTTVVFTGKVTAIGASVFNGCVNLQSVNLPETITILGNSCFYGCTSLASIDLNPAGALTLGTGVFKGSGLTSIKIPGNLSAIAQEAFMNCTELASVQFENGTGNLTINNYAFKNTGLTSVTIPGRTVEIKTQAFQNCEQLREVTFEGGNNTLTLGTYAFAGCPNLETATLSTNIVALPNYIFQNDANLKNVVIPNVSTIGSSAFAGCAALENIDISAATEIGANAFLNTGLRSITIPKACTVIGNNAFGGCGKISNFVVENGNVVFESYAITENETALARKGDTVQIIAMPGTVTGTITLPKGFVLGAYALNGVSGVTGVILPEGITEIPDYAFAYSSITQITIPSTVTSIGEGAFYSSDLTSVSIPAGVTEINDSAFENCDSLVNVTFASGSQVSYIGESAFAATAIRSIVIPEKVLYFVDTEFRNAETFANCVNLESVTFLGNPTALNPKLFMGCTALKSFTIPASVKYLGGNVFEGSGLESIEIPAGLPSLGNNGTSIDISSYIFKDCTSLKTVILHEGLQVINYGAFQGCSALESIVIPSTVTKIDTYAFGDCVNLKNVTIANGSQLQELGNNAFQGSGVTSLVLPASVGKLGTNVFENCANLTSVTFLGSLRELPQYTFSGCVSLESFVFPKGIRTVGANAFEGAGLKSLVIPAGVSFNSSPFLNCTKLETVEMEEGFWLMAYNMFKGCTALKSVKLPSTLYSISSNAFDGCTSLTVLELPITITYIEGNAFNGWTAAQTIRFACSEKLAGTFLTDTWKSGCAANIEWDYKKN